MAKIINAGVLGENDEKIVATEADNKKYEKKRVVVKKAVSKNVRTKNDDKVKADAKRTVIAEKRVANNSEKSAVNNAVFESKNIIPVRINQSLLKNLKESVETLRKIGRENAASQLETIYARGTRKKFSAAVVGEFSKGKSTFINNLLERDILPVGDLPTTALLTRIKYANNEQMVHFKGDGKKKEFPLREDSWDGLVAENFGDEDPTGFVIAGVRSRWLGENNIEIIDTPGAGDLEDKRAKPIGNALVGCDCAIITVAATAPLSLTEKLFIEQRLITKKTPFLMLIVTKLDMINEGERESVIDYIKEKLSHWEMNIPVYIPGTVEMSSDKYSDIMGYDKIKGQIKSWINDPERVKLTEMWIRAQAADVLEREIMFYSQQKDILNEEALFKIIPMQRAALASSLDEVQSRYEKVKPALVNLTTKKEQLYNQFMLHIERVKPEFVRMVNRNMADTADSVNAWLDAYEPQTNLGIIPDSGKINDLVQEISGYVSGKIEEKQLTWRKNVFEPVVRERFSEILGVAEADLKDIYDQIDKININVTGHTYETNSAPTWSRVACVVGGLLFQNLGIAISGGVNGIGVELLKTLGIQIGATTVLIMLGALNPVTWVAMLIGSSLPSLFSGEKKAVKKVKERVCDEILKELGSNAEEMAYSITNTVCAKFEEVAGEIAGAMDVEIRETENQINTIIAELEKGQESVTEREGVILACENKIKELSIGLDDLIRRLIEE